MSKKREVIKKEQKQPKKSTQQNYNLEIKFRNQEQKDAYEIIEKSQIAFLTGISGSGKTYLGISYAIKEFMAGKYKKIILTRPAVEAGEKLGHLPGELENKVQPYMIPFLDILEEKLGRMFVNAQLNCGNFEITPLAYCRGRTFKDAIILIDESQNVQKEQMLMFLTRIGENSKIVVSGDCSQNDINGKSRLQEIADAMSKIESVGQFEFKKSVRNPIIEKIIKVFEGI